MSKWNEAEGKWLVDWEVKPLSDNFPHSSWDFVRKDITAREEMGARKYGKYLTPSTSEDMLQHLYEELLDATVYIKTLILQREKKNVTYTT